MRLAMYAERTPACIAFFLAALACLGSPAGRDTTLAQPSAPRSSGTNPLAGPEWTLVTLDGKPAVEASSPTAPKVRVFVRFAPDSANFAGSGGCNRLGGRYTATDSTLHIGLVTATRRACVDPAIGRQEAAFLSVLGAVNRYRVKGDTLTMFAGVTERARMVK